MPTPASFHARKQITVVTVMPTYYISNELCVLKINCLNCNLQIHEGVEEAVKDALTKKFYNPNESYSNSLRRYEVHTI